jgi:pseudouridine synthase
MEPIRLNKAIADSGYCARRKADDLIAQGKVKVNGEVVTEMGRKIDPQQDHVTIGDQPLPTVQKVDILLNKPVGYVTSRMAGKAQKSIYQLIPTEYRAVDPAGRLDQDSSGLIILSSDGNFIHQITHPRYHLPKRYEITLDRPLSDDDILLLQAGVLLQPENKLAKMSQVVTINAQTAQYQVELITGYNRQIRRTLIELRYRVISLKRIGFGPIRLGDLAEGRTRLLTEEERDSLLASSASSHSPEKR